MLDIFLVRHAEAVGGITDSRGLRYAQPDPGLSERGAAQAGLLGRRLAAAGIGRIYASELLRARQTAVILNEHIHTEIEIRPELHEIYMGRYENKSAEEIERDDPAFYREWQRHLTDLPYPEGECGADVMRRCSGLIGQIVDGPHEKVALVTHGGTIRVLICSFLGIGCEKRFYLCAPLENCSLSHIKYDSGRKVFIVHSVNDTGHLSAK